MNIGDILIDCLTFPIATGQEETRKDGIETIEAIKRLKIEFPDVQTTLADLQGTGTNTQGDWVTGTPYPIMNPGTAPQSGETSFSAFDNAYQIPWYPAFYVICPNKKVWTDTLNI
jgi:hypothetical protein